MINIEKMTILVVDDMKSMRLTIRKDKTLRDLPVIMVTAEAQRDIVSEVAESEIDAYLLKPLTLAMLDEKIRMVIHKANHPDPSTRHRIKARDLAEQEEFEKAIEQTKLALSHKPSASRLLRQLGILHLKINKDTMGEKCLLKAAAVNKQDSVTRAHLVDFYLQKGKLEKAGRYCLEILSLSKRYDETALELGEKLLKTDSRHLSFQLFSKFINGSKKQKAVREKVIDICLAHDELEYPRALLEQSIKENPSNYDLVYKAALMFKEAGDLEKALKYFEKVDRHVRDHIGAKFQIAKICFKEGKIIKVDEYLSQILRIDPGNDEAIAFRKGI